jgi:hypothetical protein
LPRLPYVPGPHEDELLTSWLERVALFYGLDFAQVRLLLDPESDRWRGDIEDADADAALRARAVEWTGVPDTWVPPILDVTDPDTLHVSARLGYCPPCWDEDVALGRAPYVRRAWTRWQAVHCPVHRTWLTARRPRLDRECELRGWAPVWSSRAHWARAHFLDVDPALEASAVAFDPAALRPPSRSWRHFEAAAAAAETLRLRTVNGEDTTVLAAVVRPEAIASRDRVMNALRRPASRWEHIIDWTLLGHVAPRPAWLPERIACVVAAAEIVRSSAGARALFPAIAVEVSAFGLTMPLDPDRADRALQRRRRRRCAH